MTQKHVLVVEDEQHLADGIRLNLKAEGYRVTTVGDGPTALQMIQDGHDEIDLVILDLMLPGMSGYAVCESLRESGQNMPVLILSARTLAEDRTRGFDVGANQYLSKPFDLDELLSRVKNLLALHQPGSAPPAAAKRNYQFGDARVDFDTFEATVRGKTFPITPLEMKLLEYFIENEGRVIPRQELLEKVWEAPAQLNTRSPDQKIRRLRKIFEPSPAKPQHFLTVRDAGYRFVADPVSRP